jgi:hypothetical protein
VYVRLICPRVEIDNRPDHDQIHDHDRSVVATTAPGGKLIVHPRTADGFQTHAGSVGFDAGAVLLSIEPMYGHRDGLGRNDHMYVESMKTTQKRSSKTSEEGKSRQKQEEITDGKQLHTSAQC